MQNEQTNDLATLIAEHKSLMEAHEACAEVDTKFDSVEDEFEAVAEAQAPIYEKLLKTRRAILDRRPRTLDEVRAKAELLMCDKAFNYWDVDGIDIEDHIPEVIASLIPEMPTAEVATNAA